MSIARNAPCPCGSGKKYKKCCMEQDLTAERKDREAILAISKPKQKTMADFEHLKTIAFDEEDFDEEEEKKRYVNPKQIALFGKEDLPQVPQKLLKIADNEIDVEAADECWDDFEEANYEKKIAIFLKTLKEQKLMSGELAFEMLSIIYGEAIKRKEYARFEKLVDKLKKQLPEVYDSDASFYLRWKITHAITESRHDDIVACLNELAPLAGVQIDIFNDVADMLAYHGYQAPLCKALTTAYPHVNNSPDVVPWGVDEFAERTSDYVIFEYLENHPSVNANDPELIKNIKHYFPKVLPSEFYKYVDFLAGKEKRQWILEDFDLSSKPIKSKSVEKSALHRTAGKQNLDYLTFEFLGHLRSHEHIPFSKGRLAQDQLLEYLLERFEGELVAQPSMFEKMVNSKKPKPQKQPRPRHILCPDSGTLDVYVSRLLNFINLQLYKAAALIETIPAWLRFLEAKQLLGSSLHQETLIDIRSNLIKPILEIYDQMTSDPSLSKNLQRVWRI